MKRCPTCQSTYTDDSLVYCLQDGATLVKSETEATNSSNLAATLRDDSVHAHADPPPTQIMDFASAPTVQSPASSPTTLYQEPRPTIMSPVGAPPTASQAPSNTTRTVAITVIITVLLLGAGGTLAWMLFRGEKSVEKTNSNSAGASRTETTSAGEPGAQTANQTAANSGSAANASSKTGNTRGANQPDKGGRWFVILGSYPKAETSKANERLDYVRRQGFDARIVSSDEYPNMKSGLLVVVIGPSTRNSAEETLQKVRPVITDAYTKSGW